MAALACLWPAQVILRLDELVLDTDFSVSMARYSISDINRPTLSNALDISNVPIFTKSQILLTIPQNITAATDTKVKEVYAKDNFLYTSNPRDLSFSPNDFIAIFSLGNITFINILSSGGTYPRTFDISKVGDFVVSGDLVDLP